MNAIRMSCCLLMFVGAEASAINKCTVDGKPVYQEEPCASQGESMAQEMKRKARTVELERKLDWMQAQGYGLVQPRLPSAPPSNGLRPGAEPYPEMPKGRDRIALDEWHKAIAARIREDSERKNAESAATLTSMLDQQKEKCGGTLPEVPTVGMSDEVFRNCTIKARFGGATQVVVSQDGMVPLRLYVFPNAPASRVYSIGGIVTAVKP